MMRIRHAISRCARLRSQQLDYAAVFLHLQALQVLQTYEETTSQHHHQLVISGASSSHVHHTTAYLMRVREDLRAE